MDRPSGGYHPHRERPALVQTPSPIVPAAMSLRPWILALLLGVLVAPKAQAQDGRALLQKMLAAYQKLPGYVGRASVEQQTLLGGKVISRQSISSLMQVKRPNKLSLMITTRKGSRNVVCDGNNLFVLDVMNNQYVRGPATPNLSGLLTPLFWQAGIAAALDPLYFLSKNSLPAELKDIKAAGSATYNGKPVFLVTAATHTKEQTLQRGAGQGLRILEATRYWTWWIDKNTYLLQKIEVRTPNIKTTLPVQDSKTKKVTMKPFTVTNLTRHIVTDAQAKGDISDNVFVFTPPPGATEKKRLSELLKSGK